MVKDDVEKHHDFVKYLKAYEKAWDNHRKNGNKTHKVPYEYSEAALQQKIDERTPNAEEVKMYVAAREAAWKKLDDDLFNTARLYALIS